MLLVGFEGLNLPRLSWRFTLTFLLHVVFWKLQNHLSMNPTGWRICPNLGKHFGHSWSCPEEMLLARWPLPAQGRGQPGGMVPAFRLWPDTGCDSGTLYKWRSGSVQVRLLTLTMLTDFSVGIWISRDLRELVPLFRQERQSLSAFRDSPLVFLWCLSWGKNLGNSGGIVTAITHVLRVCRQLLPRSWENGINRQNSRSAFKAPSDWVSPWSRAAGTWLQQNQFPHRLLPIS